MPDNLKAEARLFWLGVTAFSALFVICLVEIMTMQKVDKLPEALSLSGVILLGLALVVVLMVLLVVFYKVTGIEDRTQALGLPSGSIRALLAFCLVIMFVCLGVFLYQGVNAPSVGKDASRVTQEDVDSLKKRFPVVLAKQVEAAKETPPSTDASGKVIPGHTQPALYDVTYFPDRSKEADDFAKLIFTQLATVFVTVIGFYFGSSTAAAGVGAGVAAAGGPATKTTTPGDGVPSALMEVKALAADADAELKQAQAALDSLNAKSDPDHSKIDKAQNWLQDIQQSIKAIQAQVDIAKTAGAKYGTAATDVENAAAAAAVLKARDTIKPLAATVKTDTDNISALLKTA